MEKTLAATISLLLISILVSACSTWQAEDQRTRVCRELKSKMMFSGATSNTRRAEIQNSDDMLLQREYDKYNCDDISSL